MFVKNIDSSHLAKCKPLIKTHKQPPYPHRLLLSGSGTPTQFLSKFIQVALAHITNELSFQLQDTKDFINKIEILNETLPPLPANASLVTCDVVKLYPSVDNNMGIPAVEEMLNLKPSPICDSNNCILEGLEIVLNNNACFFQKANGETIYAIPNSGTAMGPSHAPDYVDIFMNVLDNKLVNDCPISLITSLKPELDINLNWSRFRDDGFTIIPEINDIGLFEDHLQSLCPDKIKWTTNSGKKVDFLDVTVSINQEGKLETDVYSKNSHSYLSPNSCHNPSVFKGIARGMGRRLRMICSDDNVLKRRILEYTQYLVESGWKRRVAKKEIELGASINRKNAIKRVDKNNNKGDKVVLITTYDPRIPNKSKIIRDNLDILHSNPLNKTIFPKNKLIAADRRRKNLGEIYKPTIPRKKIVNVGNNEQGFTVCTGRCDTCKHSKNTTAITSKWDKRVWKIRGDIKCSSKNVIYIVECTVHDNFMYVGSTMDLKKRWANHKSDAKNGKSNKCFVAKHYNNLVHPSDTNISCLRIIPIEIVKYEKNLAARELFWQTNLGTFVTGGNERKDIPKVLKNRIQFSID